MKKQSTDVDPHPVNSQPASREAALLYAVQREFGRASNARIFRNNTGMAKFCSVCERVHRAERHPAYRMVKFGLAGAPDLLGVGPGGRYLAIETKSDDGRLSEEQASYHTMITRYGGLVKVVRTIEEAREWMKEVGARW